MEFKYLSKILFHIALGVLLHYIAFLPRLYFFAIIIYFLMVIVMAPKSQKRIQVLKACAYIVGVEVLMRMTNGAIFYEASKYLVILFIFFGMFYDGISNKGYMYFIYLIALVPSVIVASSTIGFDSNFRTNVAFVLSGPVCLGISALYCLGKRVTVAQVLDILLSLALPIISLTSYLFLYSPSIKDSLKGTQSNFALSGGFGPNQVSTVLGLGMFVFCVFIFLKSKSMLLTIINTIIFSAITFRAIVTFSRGGVITGVIMIAAFLVFMYFKSNHNDKLKIIFSIGLMVLVLGTTWIVSTNQTEGLISKRYNNQDSMGREKEDLSAGRVNLFLEELEGFIQNPFVGVGANGMKELRKLETGRGVVSHNEISRLLSEHGLIGVFMLIILILRPMLSRLDNPRNIFFFAFFTFWFATINHSAMRIAAPGFIYGLALLYVINEKHFIRRKRIIA